MLQVTSEGQLTNLIRLFTQISLGVTAKNYMIILNHVEEAWAVEHHDISPASFDVER